MYLLAAYIHDLSPFAIRFPDSWPIAGIRWYGLSYVAGFLAAFFLLKQYQKYQKSPLSESEGYSLLSYLMVGVLLGGRLGYGLLYDTANTLSAPWSLFIPQNGGISGMASHGGFLGAFFAIVFFALRYQKNVWRLTDVIVTLVPPGLFFGRIANFVNGELWGTITHVPWGVIFPESAPVNFPLPLIPARHPSQLYEAFLEGGILFIYMQWRFWKGSVKPGQLTAEFLMVYAVLRIVGEVFREPDAPLIFNLSRGIVYSLVTLWVGIIVYILSKKTALFYGKKV